MLYRPFRWSSFGAKPARPGVSIGPGLTTLMRILRSFKSSVQHRAKEPYCRFGGGVNTEGRHSRGARCGGRHDNRPAIRHQGQSLLNREQRTFHIGVEGLIEVLFGNSTDWSKAAAAGVGVDDIEPPFFAFDL